MPSSWTVAEPSLPALTFTYTFGPGVANALALCANGGVVLVSPPSNPPESAFTDIEARGPVRALVAPNAFHHLGLRPWRERYPDVPIFAPAQSIARIEKQSRLTGIRPLADASGIAGDRVEFVDMPHYKTGEALVRWRIDGAGGADGGGAWAWYMTDVAFNFTQRLPGPFGIIMRLTKSTPGFRRNALAGAFMVRNKRQLYAWINEQAEKTPPKVVVMCHGDHVLLADPVAGVRAAFA
jgi:hypothetical protein